MSIDNVLVSVIIPAYNAEKYIEESIRSVLGQSYKNIELIVVNDGSTDATAIILDRLALEFKQINIVHQENSGKPAISRNVGISLAQGKYICFLDADDLWQPENISLQLQILERYPDIPMCFADINIADESANITLGNYNQTKGFPENFHECELLLSGVYKISSSFFSFQLIEPAYIHMCSVMIRKKHIDSHGVFNTTLLAGEDVELWFRLMQGIEIIYIDQALSTYRKHQASLTSGGNMVEIKGYIACREITLARYPDEVSEEQLVELKVNLAHACENLAYLCSREGDLRQFIHYQAKAFVYHCKIIYIFRGIKGLVRTVIFRLKNLCS